MFIFLITELQVIRDSPWSIYSGSSRLKKGFEAYVEGDN